MGEERREKNQAQKQLVHWLKKVYLKKGFCLVDKSRMLPTIERTKEKKQNFEIK